MHTIIYTPHTLSHTPTRSDTHTDTHSHAHLCIHSHIHINMHIFPLIFTLSYPKILIHTHTFIHTHTLSHNTHTHTHTYSLSDTKKHVCYASTSLHILMEADTEDALELLSLNYHQESSRKSLRWILFFIQCLYSFYDSTQLSIKNSMYKCSARVTWSQQHRARWNAGFFFRRCF